MVDKIHLLKEGMKVHIDSECGRTRRTYGINDDMENHFLGKECIIAKTPELTESYGVSVKGIKSDKTWCFHYKDIKPLSFNNDKKIAKPTVKSVIFDPDNL